MSDIRETLAQLDQRLADLRHQITDLAEKPEPLPPPSPPSPPALRPMPLPTPGGLGEEAARGPEPPAAPPLDSALGQAVAEGIGQLGSQIEQLVSMRERLLADARELLRSYGEQLDELERDDPAEIQSALSSLLSAAGSGPGEMPGPGEIPGPDAFLSRPAFFEGAVAVTVSGANRIQTIQVLEDSLSRVPHVEHVYIRRWHAGRLWLELTMSGGVELIGELNRVLPFPFAVQSATSQEVIVSLEGEQ